MTGVTIQPQMQQTLPQSRQLKAQADMPTVLPAASDADKSAHTHSHGGLLDRFGAFLGFACAIHCIAVPLLLGVLPALGLGFLADHEFDLTIVGIASVCALFAARSGWRAHGDVRIVAGFIGAILLLVLGHALGEESLAGRVPSILGGVCLAVTHLFNLRASRKTCDHAH